MTVLLSFLSYYSLSTDVSLDCLKRIMDTETLRSGKDLRNRIHQTMTGKERVLCTTLSTKSPSSGIQPCTLTKKTDRQGEGGGEKSKHQHLRMLWFLQISLRNCLHIHHHHLSFIIFTVNLLATSVFMLVGWLSRWLTGRLADSLYRPFT